MSAQKVAVTASHVAVVVMFVLLELFSLTANVPVSLLPRVPATESITHARMIVPDLGTKQRLIAAVAESATSAQPVYWLAPSAGLADAPLPKA